MKAPAFRPPTPRTLATSPCLMVRKKMELCTVISLTPRSISLTPRSSSTNTTCSYFLTLFVDCRSVTSKNVTLGAGGGSWVHLSFGPSLQYCLAPHGGRRSVLFQKRDILPNPNLTSSRYTYF